MSACSIFLLINYFDALVHTLVRVWHTVLFTHLPQIYTILRDWITLFDGRQVTKLKHEWRRQCAWDREGGEQSGVRDCSNSRCSSSRLDSICTQAAKETDKQAAEREAHAMKRRLGMQCTLAASSVPPAGGFWCLCLCQWLAGWIARWSVSNVVMAPGAGCSLKAFLQIARETWWLMHRKPLSGWKGWRERGLHQPWQGLGSCAGELSPLPCRCTQALFMAYFYL